MFDLFVFFVFFPSLFFSLLIVFGLFKSMRYRDFESTKDDLYRFKKETPLSYSAAMRNVRLLKGIDNEWDFASSATILINKSIAHLDWTSLDPIRSYQTIPIWENPFLWGLGRFSGLEYYRRYNFTNYKRTLERGFGICGDASMVLSQLLDKKAINHEIVAFGAHVMVEAIIAGERFALDPDFGIAMKHSIKDLREDPELVTQLYTEAGYTENDGVVIGNIIKRKDYRYKSVFRFVPKRYILERLSYGIYWVSPLGVTAALYIISNSI